MWISKKKHEYLQEENLSLRKDSDTLNSILRAIDEAKDGKIVLGEIVVMSHDAWKSINTRWQADKDAVKQLLAERDWYKQKYAEFVVTSDTKG